MGNIKENKETMMEKQGKSEYNMGWQKTLVFQSRKPIVKFQQMHFHVDFFHFNHRPRVQMFKTFDLNRRNPRNRIDTILISFIKRSILREIKRFRFNLHSSHQFHKPKIQLVCDYLSTRDDFIFWINSCVKKKKKKKSLSKSSNVARFFSQLLIWSMDRSRLSLSLPSNLLGLSDTEDRLKKRRKSKSKRLQVEEYVSILCHILASRSL